MADSAFFTVAAKSFSRAGRAHGPHAREKKFMPHFFVVEGWVGCAVTCVLGRGEHKLAALFVEGPRCGTRVYMLTFPVNGYSELFAVILSQKGNANLAVFLQRGQVARGTRAWLGNVSDAMVGAELAGVEPDRLVVCLHVESHDLAACVKVQNKTGGNIFRVGGFLDFVSSSTRTPRWGVRADEQTKSN